MRVECACVPGAQEVGVQGGPEQGPHAHAHMTQREIARVWRSAHARVRTKQICTLVVECVLLLQNVFSYGAALMRAREQSKHAPSL